VFIPTREATLTFDGAHVAAVPGQVGRQMDVLAALNLLRTAINRLEPADVPLAFIETSPVVLDASTQAAAAEAILSQPLTLTVENPAPGSAGPWTIEPAALGTMLKIRRVDDGPNAAPFDVGLDPAALRNYLAPLAPGLERKEPVNARFIFNDDTRQLELLQPALPARSLDVEASIARINEALAQRTHIIPLVFRTVAPAVGDDAAAAALGITQLVSQQATFFRGSGPERVNNIKVAAALYHGLLVAPNATFSFGEHLGDVSLDTGFAEALIIFGGRTIRGVGGGVCQVATTVFRAAYFGGFPITERNPHAYQVHYYDKGEGLTPYGKTSWNGPGLDATVYTPLVDFKFRNDTPYWLLMETYVDEKNAKLTWKFYSTWDGREVKVTGPDISNVVPAPETLYEFDETLPPGEKKQVDFAADGADVVVRRVVTRSGAVVNPDEKPLVTKYQPWRAIYHYGPGAEGVPAQ
jgi:vancomycin resistance protein YoaR